MKKVYIIFFLCLFLLTGCENNNEEPKDEYISLRNEIQEKNEYTSLEDLPLDITVKYDRVDEEKVKYKILLNNPKKNMKEMKCIVIPNYPSEELYPSFGLFDNKKELLTSKENDSIELDNIFKTTKNLSKINLELKIWIEYIDDSGEKNEIYYKTT